MKDCTGKNQPFVDDCILISYSPARQSHTPKMCPVADETEVLFLSKQRSNEILCMIFPFNLSYTFTIFDYHRVQRQHTHTMGIPKSFLKHGCRSLQTDLSENSVPLKFFGWSWCSFPIKNCHLGVLPHFQTQMAQLRCSIVGFQTTNQLTAWNDLLLDLVGHTPKLVHDSWHLGWCTIQVIKRGTGKSMEISYKPRCKWENHL